MRFDVERVSCIIVFSRASGSDRCPGNLYAVWFLRPSSCRGEKSIEMEARYDSYTHGVDGIPLGSSMMLDIYMEGPPWHRSWTFKSPKGVAGWVSMFDGPVAALCDQGLWSTKQTTTLCSSSLMPTYEDFFGGWGRHINTNVCTENCWNWCVYNIYCVYLYTIYILYIYYIYTIYIYYIHIYFRKHMFLKFLRPESHLL